MAADDVACGFQPYSVQNRGWISLLSLVMNLLTAVKDPRLQVRYQVPNEKVMGLLGLRAAGLDHVFEHIILAIPVMEMPVSVFFNYRA